uniref:CDC20/Fizzy WD40 domain-containing protein n=1 Tax=Nelumbo nucifera TaxID=4432 RepID=A0A822XVZ3_NELNU|nr:TPA_asm: hypothetical protein HUJ06_025974 [Nelumbo nucifera]
MDVGFSVQEQMLQRRRWNDYLDRFIPNRSAMDFDFAQHMLTKRMKEGKDNLDARSEAYGNDLAKILGVNRSRILAFKERPPTPDDLIPHKLSFSHLQLKLTKTRRHIPETPEMVLDVYELLDDYSVNLLDWSSRNVLSVALENTVYLWDASNKSVNELLTTNNENGPITSVSWSPDGRHIAIGLNNSDVQIWGFYSQSKGRHQSRVGSLDWNNINILTTGAVDGLIVNNDVRIRLHIVQTYRGHSRGICQLKWSDSGQKLASGGVDNLLFIWDQLLASSNSQSKWLHRLKDHTSAVKALAWCPFQGNLLASGGGRGDECIKFWNICIGACLKSIDTGSEVCSLLWNKSEWEILSSHGFPKNQLTLWKYPEMLKITKLNGPTARVLFMAQMGAWCICRS